MGNDMRDEVVFIQSDEAEQMVVFEIELLLQVCEERTVRLASDGYMV